MSGTLPLNEHTMRLYVGTSGYSYAAWKGRFYPARLPAKEMLRYYAGHLATVEINSSFYRIPAPAMLATWAEQVPEHFLFAFKAPRRITHERRLSGVVEDLERFIEVTQGLCARQGPVLVQLPPNFPRDDARLRDFLQMLPTAAAAAFEFRHASWFNDAVYEALAARNCALAVTDTDEAGATPMLKTADWTYVRLRRIQYTDEQLEEWLARLEAQNPTRAFVYFKHEDEARGPEFALRLLALHPVHRHS